MAIIGIDLGTTNSLVAVWKDGKSVLIPNSYGEFLTPSVVSITQSNTVVVGKVAKERLISYPEYTAEHFKRYMGSEKKFSLGENVFSAEELSSFILRQLCNDAEKFLGEPVTEAIISVPAYFDDKQRYATKLAGKLAGINVERIINEPSAAAIAYHNAMDAEGMYLVFDFGGGTLDVSVVDIFFNIIDIISIAGDNHLGGQDIDEIIVNTFLNENPSLNTIISAKEKASLYRLAEECKIALTSSNHAFFIYKKDDEMYSMELTNQKLSEMCMPILARMQATIHKALQDAKKSIQEMSGVIPIGGSCIMPLVHDYIQYTTKKKPLKGIDPNLAVGYGVGIISGIKNRDDGAKDFVLSDICPFSLGISSLLTTTNMPYFSCIIPRNTSLPASKQSSYCTVQNNQTSIKVEILQGESPNPSENIVLGTIDMKVPPLPAGEAYINVRFTYDINGILEVDIYCPLSNEKEHTILIKNKSMPEKDIQKKILELSAIKENAEIDINDYYIAKGERLFAESFGYTKSIIANELSQYQLLLKSQPNTAKLKKAQKRLEIFFDKLDTFDDGLNDFSSHFDFGDEFDEE